MLEIISPAGFDQFFVEMTALISSGEPSPDAVAALSSAYGIQVDAESTAAIAAEQQLITRPPE